MSEGVRLQNLVVWITGASSGIGAEFARQLARRGNRLILSARRSGPMEALGLPDAVVAPCDVTDPEAVRRAHDAGTARFGPVDVLIANAGIGENVRIERWDAAAVRRIMEVSFHGTVNAVACVLPSMVARRRGVIVGMSSLGSYRGFGGHGAYCAAKAAVRVFLESLRCEASLYGIRVVVLCPGFVRTPMTERNEFPMPQLLPASEAVRRMIAAIERGEREYAFPMPFAAMVRSLRFLPAALFDRLNRLALRRRKRPANSP
jgi:short-subunit dehydrogenase